MTIVRITRPGYGIPLTVRFVMPQPVARGLAVLARRVPAVIRRSLASAHRGRR